MNTEPVSFSVVMCTFNAQLYLVQAVQSVLNQTMKDFEFIIVDDGSTDATKNLLSGLTDPRISVIYLPQNVGLLRARTIGFSHAKGKYIALMDSDDVCDPERLALQLEALDRGDVEVCGAFHKTHYISTGKIKFKRSHTSSNDLRALLLLYSPMCNPVVSFRRSLLDQTNYRQEYEHAEDYGFWCELSAKGARFCNVAKPLLTYVVHPGQISQKKRDAALTAFYTAQSEYQQWVGLNSFPPAGALNLRDRVATGRQVLSAVYRKIGPVSLSVCLALYRACQVKRTLWHSLALRFERYVFAFLWYSVWQHERR